MQPDKSPPPPISHKHHKSAAALAGVTHREGVWEDGGKEERRQEEGEREREREIACDNVQVCVYAVLCVCMWFCV